jgi:hypothetical protein
MKKEALDVLIFIEHIDRELETAKKIGQSLDGVGISFKIANLYLESKICEALYNPAVVIVPFYYYDQDGISKFIAAKFKNCIIISLDWEQILYPINTIIKRPRGENAINEIIRISWSNQRTLELVKNKVPKSIIWETGHPLFNKYRMPAPETKKQKILFIENYTWTKKSLRALKKIAVTYKLSLNDLVNDVNVIRRCRVNTGLMLIRLAIENPDIVLTFRPRPNSLDSEWKIFFKAITGEIPNNFVIDQDNNLTNTIIANDICLTNLSTGIMEAAFYKKEIALLRSGDYPASLVYEWEKCVSIKYNYEALNRFIKSNSDSYKQLESHIHDQYLKEMNFYEILTEKLNAIIDRDRNNQKIKNKTNTKFKSILIMFYRLRIVQKYIRYRYQINYDSKSHSKDSTYFILPS